MAFGFQCCNEYSVKGSLRRLLSIQFMNNIIFCVRLMCIHYHIRQKEKPVFDSSFVDTFEQHKCSF